MNHKRRNTDKPIKPFSPTKSQTIMATTKPTLYSLHVGINEYPKASGVSNLNGCVNDAKKLSSFIKKHFSESYTVDASLLLNEDATYLNIVKNMGDKHLGKAKKGDVVFFTYSGHGAKEASAPEFKDPGGMGETLVCYDSRPYGKDLADKELGALMKRLENNGAYIVTLLDCCHSGSGFRGDEAALGKARQCGNREGRRALHTYLGGYYAEMLATKGKVEVPFSKQLNISACDRSEKAYEHGEHGLFTFCLLEVLKETPRISYAKLYDRTRRMMASIADRQHPLFEPTGHFDSYDAFLRPGVSADAISRYQLEYKEGHWVVNMGSLHGVPASSDVDAVFAVFEKSGNLPIGHATVTEVGFQESKVDFDGEMGGDYEAKLISLPDPAIEVFMNENFSKKLKEVQTTHADVKPVYSALNEEDTSLKYALEYTSGRINIQNRLTGELAVGFKTDRGEKGIPHLFNAAFDHLDHIAQWERVLAMDKSSGALNSNDFKFEIIVDGKEGNPIENSATIQLFGKDGVFEEVPIQVRLTNPYKDSLHFSLLYLQNDYSIAPLENEMMPKGEKVIFSDNVQLDKNEYEYTFYLKLIVSTENIKSHLVELTEMEGLGTVVNIDTKGTTRGGLASRRKKSPVKDWFVKTMEIKLVGIDREINESQAVALEAGKIKILPNKKISAKVNTTTADSSHHRSASWLNVLPQMLDEEAAVFLENKSRSTGSSGPVVLNLEEVKGAEHIAEHPLEMEVQENLKNNEALVPITFDGEKNCGAGQIGKASRRDGKGDCQPNA